MIFKFIKHIDDLIIETGYKKMEYEIEILKNSIDYVFQLDFNFTYKYLELYQTVLNIENGLGDIAEKI